MIQNKKIKKTGERMIPNNFQSNEELITYLRHLVVYKYAKKKIKKNHLVVEVGSGEGYGTNLISSCCKQIVGLDVDKNTIIHSSKKYRAKNIKFIKYNGKKIPLDKKTYDVALSFQVIEHVIDDNLYLKEIHKVLKNNGFLLLTTPNKTYRLKPNQKPWNRFHVREYYPNELKILLKKYYSSVELFGIFGNETIQQIEMKRLNNFQNLLKIDPLSLRNYIPENFKPKIINLLKIIFHSNLYNKKNNEFIKKYSIKDFYIDKKKRKSKFRLISLL